MKITIERWLAERREREPSVKKSVSIWLERDKLQKPFPIRRRASSRESKPTPASSKGRVRIYVPQVILTEVEIVAGLQGKNISQLFQQAWELAREKIRTYPTHNFPQQAPEGKQ